jgi:Cdc6-like AAA superfamily ATPase
VLARHGERVQTLTRLQGFKALGVKQIMKQLHVQLVILDDEDFLRHRDSDDTLLHMTDSGSALILQCHQYP